MAESHDLQCLHREFVEETLPRMLVNPFIVSLWSCYEFMTKDLAVRIQEKKGLERAFGEFNGD